MSVNEDMIQPSSDSFWEVDCYKRTAKRHEDGHKLCGDLMQLIQDRADIEKHYAKSLKAWSQKWNGLIEKGPEYGTTEAACKGVLTEAERTADIHLQVKEKLLNEVQTQIKQWRNEYYHKPMVGPCKETKELEDGFKKAQKPWAKRLGKVIKTKKDYHTACKLEKTATVQENNARGDTSVSSDQLKRLQDKVEKCRRDVETTKDKYQAALNDINSYNAKYMEDMTEIFNKSQSEEERRLKFFKEMLFGIHKCLDISSIPEFPMIYTQLHATINTANYQQDLRWWSQNHGIDMAMNWPTFEEYSPDLHSISRKDKKGTVSGGDGITLTSIHKNDSLPQNPTPVHQPASQTSSYNSYNNAPKTTVPITTAPANSNGASQNPFGDDDWDTQYDTAINDDNIEGVPVRALYDYKKQEDDELSFNAGDVFNKIAEEDEQGWCKGRKDGRVGLYPSSYVEVI